MSSSTLTLPGKVDDRDLIITGLRAQVQQLQEQLATAQGRNNKTDQGLRELRTVLTPLHKALKHVFGELDDMGVEGTAHPAGEATSGVDSGKMAIWEDWKKKFPGYPAKAIDTLLLHKQMTQGQLRIAIGCATGTITNVVVTLNKAGIINKANGKISLKEL